MPRVVFTTNLQRHVSCPPRTVDGDTVATALGAVFNDNRRARDYILDDRGALRTHMVIFVNGEPIRDRAALSDSVEAEDEIFVMQALWGAKTEAHFQQSRSKHDLSNSPLPTSDGQSVTQLTASPRRAPSICVRARSRRIMCAA